jgi:uncharacterized protein (TIGR03435 family)
MKNILLATAGATVIIVPLTFSLPPAPRLHAQSSAGHVGSPAFEVASVKPVKLAILLQRGFFCGFLGGRFNALNTLEGLIACAYGIRQALAHQEILGGPKWLDTDPFEIIANAAPDNVPGSQSEGLILLTTLLADRFKLAVHRENKEAPMYALVIARRDGRLGPHTSSDRRGLCGLDRRRTPGCAARISARPTVSG